MPELLPHPLHALLQSASRHPGPHGGTHYTLPSGAHLVGGPPGRGELDEAWMGIAPMPPAELVAVWRVHDGIGRPGDHRSVVLSPCLLPAREARPLTSEVRFGENDVLFSPADWLWVATMGDVAWCVNEAGEAAPLHRFRHLLGAPRPLERLWEALAAALSAT